MLFIPFEYVLYSYPKEVSSNISLQYERDSDLLTGIYLYGVKDIDEKEVKGILEKEKEEYVIKIIKHIKEGG